MLTAALAIGAVACGNEDDGDNGDGSGTATELTATLLEIDGSGVTGTAILTETDSGGTRAVVTINGGLEEGSHESHLAHGTCDDVSDLMAVLTELEAGPDGSVPATTTVFELDFDHLRQLGHVVDVHALDFSIVACGPVEGGS